METLNGRGVSSTPVSTPNKMDRDSSWVIIPEKVLDKRVLIDWLSFTFDDLDFDRYYEPEYKRYIYHLNDLSVNNDYIMTNLFRLFGEKKLELARL